ncbi:hypothetical protein JKP88DRAFT_279227 [Tribonema minus]|uniref:Uncharacterized protein n=1 Tax=Tribonema minus TaxID=303371 RepID=A0A835YSG8_9STRA|nr:hypothetical protein JKP88DRAFT_279227 [Tribonema minus]
MPAGLPVEWPAFRLHSSRVQGKVLVLSLIDKKTNKVIGVRQMSPADLVAHSDAGYTFDMYKYEAASKGAPEKVPSTDVVARLSVHAHKTSLQVPSTKPASEDELHALYAKYARGVLKDEKALALPLMEHNSDGAKAFLLGAGLMEATSAQRWGLSSAALVDVQAHMARRTASPAISAPERTSATHKRGTAKDVVRQAASADFAAGGSGGGGGSSGGSGDLAARWRGVLAAMAAADAEEEGEGGAPEASEHP